MSSFAPYWQGLIPVLLSFAFWRAEDCHICLPVGILRLWVSLLLMDQICARLSLAALMLGRLHLFSDLVRWNHY